MPARQFDPGGESRRGLVVLLVEDNAVNQQVASSMLRRRGHYVDIAENGLVAVEAVRERAYDIVLMDIQMPVLDGISATRRIRGLPGLDQLPIIALTAHSTREDRVKCREAGMNGFLTKPFRPDDLYMAVETYARPHPSADTDGPVASPEKSPAVDVEHFHAAMREVGIEDIVEPTLRLYLKEAPARMAALKKAIAERNALDTQMFAHAFKSSSAAIEAKQLADYLFEAEKAGKQGKVDEFDRILKVVQDQYDAVVEQLESVLGQNQ